MAAVDLKTLADAVLAVAVAGLQSESLEVPERRYVANGQVALDNCEQLTVSVTFLNPDLPSGSSATQHKVTVKRSVSIDVQISRCVPVMGEGGSPPSIEDLDASAAIILADGWCLFRALLRARGDGIGGACDSVEITQARPQGPEGQQAGWIFGLVAQL